MKDSLNSTYGLKVTSVQIFAWWASENYGMNPEYFRYTTWQVLKKTKTKQTRNKYPKYTAYYIHTQIYMLAYAIAEEYKHYSVRLISYLRPNSTAKKSDLAE